MLQSALSLFLACCLLGCLDCTELTVKRGADAILQCSGHNATEIMLRWNKPELQSEGYLLYFKDGQFQEEHQHELFKGRVELKDPDWKKTGDFSVILKHVTPNDAGTYECHAGYEGQKSQLLSSLILKVEKPELTVKRGADAILQCSGHNATEIMLIWEKPELQSEGYLLYFRDGQFQDDFQHELFKGRVELKDPDWKKTGNFSVILKHVTTNDAGTYECHAGYEGKKSQLLSSFILKVEKPGQTEEQKKDGGNEGEEEEEEGKEHGSAGLIVGLVGFVVGLLVFAAAGLVYFYKCRNTRTQYHAPHGQEQADTNV